MSPSRSDDVTVDPLRPADYADTSADSTDAGRPSSDDAVTSPALGPVGWARWGWRQLTSMRTALLLLLLLAIAAIPGSLVPQRSADPNGVSQYFTDNPDLAPILAASPQLRELQEKQAKLDAQWSPVRRASTRMIT